MLYTLKYESECDVIKVEISGVLNHTMRKKVLAAVAEQLHACNCQKVLINVSRVTVAPGGTMMEMMELVDYMKFLDITSDVKMVFVSPEEEEHRKYLAEIAQTEGLNIHYSLNMDDATAWLNELDIPV